MNNPNSVPDPKPSPFVPQGTMPDPRAKSRARVKLAVFFILSIHVIGIMALLMQGCRKPQDNAEQLPSDMTASNSAPALDNSNLPPVDAAATNIVMPPPAPPSLPPSPPANVQEYVVAKGDSFYTIAKHFGVTMKAIQEANPGVEPTKLKVGQKLNIPA